MSLSREVPAGLTSSYSIQSMPWNPDYRQPEIRHYTLKPGGLERTDPVALNPQDFVAFWLRSPLVESAKWTEESSRSKLRDWIKQHKGPFAEFGFETLHCSLHPDLWQLSTEYGENGDRKVYFSIRWRPPYRFTMVSISDHASPECREIDPEADKPRSLFSPQ